MGLFQALILGVVQGVTEFLPISSSGHLVLLPAVLGWTPPSLVFDTTVHLATLVAVVAVFRRDLLGLIVSWWQGLFSGQPFKSTESRLAWCLILGTVPGILAGLLLEEVPLRQCNRSGRISLVDCAAAGLGRSHRSAPSGSSGNNLAG